MEFVCKLSERNTLVFVPYNMPYVSSGEKGRSAVGLISWLTNDLKKYAVIDLRTTLIENFTALKNSYPQIVPANIKLGMFSKDAKPLVVIEKYAVIKKDNNETTSNWGNLLIWQLLFDDKRRNSYIKSLQEAGDIVFGQVTVLDEQIVLIDASDDFIASVLKKIDDGFVEESYFMTIIRYFRYLSFLPIALNDLESSLVFTVVIDKLEDDISKALKIERPKEIFSRMIPFDLYYQYLRQNTHSFIFHD